MNVMMRCRREFLTVAGLVATAGLALPASAQEAAPDALAAMLDVMEDAREVVAQPDADDARENAEPGELANPGEIEVSDNLITELHVNNEELTTVLQLLGIQSQRNIVTGQNVSGTVTANFYGVTFYEALDAILNVNGYGYIERGNFVYVYTLEELREIRQKSMIKVTKVFKLNYISASDAAEFINPIVSEAGEIRFNAAAEQFAIPGDTPTGAESYSQAGTIVVYDYEEHIKEIETLLNQIDTRPAQVLVEATILQAQLDEANAFGFDFSIVDDLDFSDFTATGGPLTAARGLVGGQGAQLIGGTETPIGISAGKNVTTTVGNASGPATFRAGVVDGDVAVFLRMLDEVTDTTVLSNPKILTLNRQAARVLVGQKVGFLNTTATETSTTQSVEFLDTGTQLFFRPFVSEDGFIRMELKPSVSSASLRNQTDVNGVVVTIPDEDTNELVTNVMVRDGQTVVLGGLFNETTTATRRQVPFMGDLPIIGAAFRGHDDSTTRNEILFLIKPTIVNDRMLLEQGLRGEDAVRRTRAGAREGLLPWSRDRMTAMYNVEAERLYLKGDYKKALWKVRQSLTMNPVQAEAIALRERLIGAARRHSTRRMLEDIVRGETDALLDSRPDPATNNWWRDRLERRGESTFDPVEHLPHFPETEARMWVEDEPFGADADAETPDAEEGDE